MVSSDLNKQNGNEIDFSSYLASVLAGLNINTESFARDYFTALNSYGSKKGTSQELFQIHLLEIETEKLLSKIQAFKLDDMKMIETHFYKEIVRLKSFLKTDPITETTRLEYKGEVTGIMV